MIALIFDTDKLYKHCMYCGTIYDGAWQTALYQNGPGPIPGRVFGDYRISTGVCQSPHCLARYQQQLDEIRGNNGL